jgi:Inorganic Pyrophosphatase/Putative phage serine protease XkdF
MLDVRERLLAAQSRLKRFPEGDLSSDVIQKLLMAGSAIHGGILFENGDLSRRITLAAQMTDVSAPEGKKRQGNYRKGRFSDSGLTIVIENPRGSVRSGTDKDGKAWSNLLNLHYGFISRTESGDGEPLDCFLGDYHQSEKVYVVDQVREDGSFDEHKAMLYFSSMAGAEAGYLSCYPAGWQGIGAITELDWESFKRWCKSGDCTKPLSPELQFDIAKSYEVGEQMFVYGPVLVPEEVDHHENWAYEDEIRKACRAYMDYQAGDLQHQVPVPRQGLRLTQNFVAPTDFVVEGTEKFIKKGSWIVEFEVIDRVIKRDIKNGRYKGFSVGGKARINWTERPDGLPQGSGPSA